MTPERWRYHLMTLTGGFGALPGSKKYNKGNHLGLTFEFFKGLGIDEPSKRFLDLGCGDGILKNMVESQWRGVDHVKFDDPDTDQSDIHELELYNDEEFDIVFSSHVLEHTVSPSIVLNECKRVMKDDGDLIIGVPCYPNFKDKIHHAYLFTDGGWRHLFEFMGFKLMKSAEARGCGMYHLKKAWIIKTSEVGGTKVPSRCYDV